MINDGNDTSIPTQCKQAYHSCISVITQLDTVLTWETLEQTNYGLITLLSR